jgi:hypothetical protein
MEKIMKYLLCGTALLLIVGLIFISGCTDIKKEQAVPNANISAEPAQEKHLVTIFNTTGKGTTSTQPFMIEKGKIVFILFGYLAENEAANYASMSVYLMKVGKEGYVAHADLDHSIDPNSTNDKFEYTVNSEPQELWVYNIKPGMYYLKIIEANTVGWVVQVNELK